MRLHPGQVAEALVGAVMGRLRSAEPPPLVPCGAAEHDPVDTGRGNGFSAGVGVSETCPISLIPAPAPETP